MPKCGDFRIYTKEKVKGVLSFVMKHAYFPINNQVFQQVIGIPMGSDPTPFIANLFLYFYENKFLDKLKILDHYATFLDSLMI